VTASPSDAAFWEALYRDGDDGWELGVATPPLVRWFAAHSPRGKRALVVGCGRGHEARMLHHAGARVTAIDFAEPALAAARKSSALEIDWRLLDLFALPKAGEKWDLLVEHTCFCAIDPARRDEYVDVVAGALVPGGELVGLFYAHGRPGGPPFTTTDEELERRFTARFAIDHREVPPDSVARRAGDERLLRMRLR